MSIFDTVEKIFISKNNFDLSHQSLLTGKMGTLIPFLTQEILPGDRFSINSNVFCRFLGLLAPIMSKVEITVHYWYCPNRILWKQWNDFIRARESGEEEPVFPYMVFNDGVLRSSLADYLGLPANTLDENGQEVINLLSTEKINALPFRAYAKIYNEFYRDEQLQDEIGFSDESGLDEITNKDLQYRAWKKDYFTSARPQQQYGDGVVIPLGASAPVYADNVETLGLNKTSVQYRKVDGTAVDTTVNYGLQDPTDPDSQQVSSNVGLTGNFQLNSSGKLGYAKDNIVHSRAGLGSSLSGQNFGSNESMMSGYTVDYSYQRPSEGVVTSNKTLVYSNRQPIAPTNLRTDLSDASAIDIVKLRLAFQLQKFKERASRTGNRIKEFYRAHWGVKTSDARLDLPEYLGGSKNLSLFSEVIQTSESGNTPLGSLAGHGVGYNGKVQVKNKYFEEYGWVIGILNIQPKSSYCQGLDRKFSKTSQFDYPLPVFQHIGEQEILEKEIYAKSANGNNVFGYAPRYAEYKHEQDKFHGDFCGNLSYYHLGRFFGNDPQLNSDFIEAKPSDRIFAVNDGTDNILIQVQHNILARRKLDYFSNPGLVDHF